MTGNERFADLLKRDNTNPKDLDRKALFYILAHANDGDLYNKSNKIYDFKDHSINPEVVGYTDDQLEENRKMGEPWMERCTICELPLSDGEMGRCSHCYNLPDLCSSAESLIKLGFNLYNGYSFGRCDVNSIFRGLDDNNYKIAMDAIAIKYGRYEVI